MKEILVKEIKKALVDLDYFDTEGKRNIILINKINKNDYQVKGQTFNANSLISDLNSETSCLFA